MTSANFPEIKRLPGWIKEGVKDNFEKNPMIKMNDVIAIDFFNASPDFDENQTYPVWYFIKMRKVLYEKTSISNEEKLFKRFIEENVHYRRGLGLLVIKEQIENALKKPFRSFGKPDRLALVMISIDAKTTLESAQRFLLKNINMINEGELNSSPHAIDYVAKRLSEGENRQRFSPRKWTKNVKQEKD